MNKEQYLLILLMEECAEVQHACAKAIRFGLNDGYPGTDRTNLKDLQRELVDLTTVLYCIQEENIMHIEYTEEQVLEKRKKVHEYMQVSTDLGILEQ